MKDTKYDSEAHCRSVELLVIVKQWKPKCKLEKKRLYNLLKKVLFLPLPVMQQHVGSMLIKVGDRSLLEENLENNQWKKVIS